MELSIIAAVGKNKELGKNNDLIWRFPKDMKFFKETTIGHKIIMGRKTFESLPGLLSGRKHLVLTRKKIEFSSEVETYKSIEQFLETYKNCSEEIFNIGGASIYNELFEYASSLYLTEIDSKAQADVFFPEFNELMFERYILAEQIDEKSGTNFKHVLYKKRNR